MKPILRDICRSIGLSHVADLQKVSEYRQNLCQKVGMSWLKELQKH